jgi:hypothetical protein
MSIKAIAEPPTRPAVSPVSGNGVVSPAKAEIDLKMKYHLGLEPGNAVTISDSYRAAAWALRERLIDGFDKTHAYWK